MLRKPKFYTLFLIFLIGLFLFIFSGSAFAACDDPNCKFLDGRHVCDNSVYEEYPSCGTYGVTSKYWCSSKEVDMQDCENLGLNCSTKCYWEACWSYECGECWCPTGDGDTHRECDADCSCVEVDGSGDDECGTDADCYPCGTCIPCQCGISLAALESSESLASAGREDNKSVLSAAWESPFDKETQPEVTGLEAALQSEKAPLTQEIFNNQFLLSSIIGFITELIGKVRVVVIG